MKDLNTDPVYLFIFPAAYWVASKTVLYWISFPVCSVRYLIMHYNSSCWLQADKKALVSQSECVMWNKKKILVALRSLHTWRVFYAFNIYFSRPFSHMTSHQKHNKMWVYTNYARGASVWWSVRVCVHVVQLQQMEAFFETCNYNNATQESTWSPTFSAHMRIIDVLCWRFSVNKTLCCVIISTMWLLL